MMEATTATKRIVGGVAPTAGHLSGRRRGSCAAWRCRVRAGRARAPGASGAGDGQRWRETSVVWRAPSGAAHRAFLRELQRVERWLRRCGHGPMVCDVAVVMATPASLRWLLPHFPRQWPTRRCSRRQRQRQRRFRSRGRHPVQQHLVGRPRHLAVGRQPFVGLGHTIQTIPGAPRQCDAVLGPPRTLRRLAVSYGGLARRARGGPVAPLDRRRPGGELQGRPQGTARLNPRGPLGRSPHPHDGKPTLPSLHSWTSLPSQS